jgi:formylglycine-generating enzyme
VKNTIRPSQVITRFLSVLAGCGLVLGTVWNSWAGSAESLVPEPPVGMQSIAGGVYTPLFKEMGEGQQINVAPFALDTYLVTNAQYVTFIQANPRWRRSQVSALFADAGYLRHWQADVPPPEIVTSVSWFAARAYCRWRQKRLPSTAEWEYVALASETAPDGRTDSRYQARLLEWYALPSPAFPPSGGQWAAELLGCV